MTYTMIVSNSGPSAADGVVVTDNLPAGVAFISASTGCSHSGGTVTCDLGTLVSNFSSSIRIVVTPLVDGEFSNSARVSSLTSDPQVANNITTATVTVSQVSAVPALSPWGMLGAAVCLAGIATAGKKRVLPNRY
jgi:uncharacterized repeat protein (TIGR01451 family)